MSRWQTQIFLLKKKEFCLSPEHMGSYHLPTQEKKACGAIGSNTGMALALSSVLILGTGDRTCLSMAHSALFPRAMQTGANTALSHLSAPRNHTEANDSFAFLLKSMGGEITVKTGRVPSSAKAHKHFSTRGPEGKGTWSFGEWWTWPNTSGKLLHLSEPQFQYL